MRAVVVSGGTLVMTDRIRSVLDAAALRVCADSGAAALLAAGYQPDIVIGDFDSLDQSLIAEMRQRGLPFDMYDTHKDQTDTELALDYAIQRGATEITLLGALGGQRFDHALANVFLLARPDFATQTARILSHTCQVQVARRNSSVVLQGKPGEYVSLVPLDSVVEGVTTTGLAYELQAATLFRGPALGISNEFIENTAQISVQYGLLVVIHEFRTAHT